MLSVNRSCGAVHACLWYLGGLWVCGSRWFGVCGVGCREYGICFGYVVDGSCFLVCLFFMWYLVFIFWYVIFLCGMWYLLWGTCFFFFLEEGGYVVWYSHFGMLYSIYRVWHVVFGICHSLFIITYYSGI